MLVKFEIPVSLSAVWRAKGHETHWAHRCMCEAELNKHCDAEPVSWRVCRATSSSSALCGSLRGNNSHCQKQAGVHNSLKYRPACLYICQLIAAETKSPVFKEKGIWQGSKPASVISYGGQRFEKRGMWTGKEPEVFLIYAVCTRGTRSHRTDKDMLLIKGIEPSAGCLWKPL